MMQESENMSSECEIGINCKAWTYFSVMMTLSSAGFFLFIYYYNTRQTTPADTNTGANRNSTSSTTTLQTNLDLPNPYINLEK